MRHRIAYDEERALFIVTTEGAGQPAGIIAFLDAILAHPRWRPGLSILLDHRKLSIEGIQSPGIEEVSRYFVAIGPRLGNGRIALVMNKDVDFGIARAWEMITEDEVAISIRVFRNIDQARGWVTSKDTLS